MFGKRFFKQNSFPDPRSADHDGLVAVSHRITPELLLEAYRGGIFPWSDRPACWYSPDPRAIFDLASVRIPKRLQRTIRQGGYQVTYDRVFAQVMKKCLAHHSDSWISPSMVDAYTQFHRLGYAHSVEVWQHDRLVGGLYGVQVGAVFAGESMFHDLPDCSKIAFAHLVQKLRDLGVVLLDAQVLNDHTARLGAFEVSREEFLERLVAAHRLQLPQHPWS